MKNTTYLNRNIIYLFNLTNYYLFTANFANFNKIYNLFSEIKKTINSKVQWLAQKLYSQLSIDPRKHKLDKTRIGANWRIKKTIRVMRP